MKPLQFANMRLAELDKIGGWVLFFLAFIAASLWLK